MALSSQTIKKILFKNNIVNEEEFSNAEKESLRTNIPVQRLLIAQGKITQQKLLELLSAFFDIPIFNQATQALKLEIIAVLPEITARQKQILVFDHDTVKNAYKVAMVDPTDIETINFLEEYLKGDIEPYITSPDTLKFGFQLYKRRSSENFEATIAEKIREVKGSLSSEQENILENIPLVELVDTIIGYGATLDASDVYFIPQEDSLKIRFRVDGLLHDVISVDRSINDGIVARTKTLAGLRIDEHYKPQDGRFRYKSADTDLDIRIAVMPTLFGEKTTLRLLAGGHSFLTFEELGMEPGTSEQLQKALKKPYGMLLSTGPTGSGKTTTIYSMLYLLNTPEVHIVTIEDPIEYIVPNTSQTQVNPQAGITFASGLRSFLRHSPDIIVLGEIRDKETTEISVNAALTGHLVISTLHTNDAPGAIIRLMELGVEPFLISATLNAILAQRLVRRICPNCKEQYTAEPSVIQEVQKKLGLTQNQITFPSILYRGKGCSLCHNTGFQGRMGLFEVFFINEEVRNLIGTRGLTLDALRKAAQQQGMITLFEDGIKKVAQGVTSLEELLRVATE